MKLFIKVAIQVVLALALVGAGLAGYQYMTKSRPQVVKKKRPVKAPVVRIVTATSGSVPVTVLGEGTVKPLRETTLAAQVSGRVVHMADHFAAGEACKEDEVILRIDPTDYKLALSLSRAKLKEAETALFKAKEEAAAALEEWSRLGKGKNPPPLVAKKPQLAQAQAGLEAARASLRQTELDLKRTEVKVPFQGRIISKAVDLGQFVSRGQAVARLYSTEAAEITVYLEDKDLAWIDVPGLTAENSEATGSSAKVRVTFAGQDMDWPARIVRAEAELDQKTRLTPVVVRVDNPYSRIPPLMAGLFVRVEIQGRTQEMASLIPRSAIRQGGLIWVVEDAKIRFRPVRVLRYQGDMALVSPGLEEGTSVVTSNLKIVTEGLTVRAVNAKGMKAGQAQKPDAPGLSKKPGPGVPEKPVQGKGDKS